MKIYTKIHLLKALKEAGLPATYKSLLKYENLGIIDSKGSIEGQGSAGSWRLYTEDEIKSIVGKIKAYKDA